MKIGLLFIICLVIQTVSGFSFSRQHFPGYFQQKSQQNIVNGQALPELLKNAQTQTDELHSFMASTLLKFRTEMSNILTGIVNESLSHILKSLDASLPPPSDTTSEEVDSESEQIGKRISRCSAQADTDIQAAIKQFFSVFNPIHDKSFAVLNTVLEQIIEWNAKKQRTDIVATVHNVQVALSDEFVSAAVPALEDELRKFKNVLYLIPSSVSRCVGAALNN